MKNKFIIRTVFALALTALAACKQGKKDDTGMLSLKAIPVKTIKLSSSDSVGLIMPQAL